MVKERKKKKERKNRFQKALLKQNASWKFVCSDRLWKFLTTL